jgi:alpha-tubulin suppressor-like RCC1 family protein
MIKSNGTVWGWGSNNYGQLGNGTTATSSVQTQVSGLTNAVSVAAGASHTLALKSDGTVWSWGYNSNGQLGDGTTVNKSTPVQVSGLSGAVSVAAGGNTSYAIKSDGTVWAWGYNNYGQLGDGTAVAKTTPVQVTGVTNNEFVVNSADSFRTIVNMGEVVGTRGEQYIRIVFSVVGDIITAYPEKKPW